VCDAGRWLTLHCMAWSCQSMMKVQNMPQVTQNTAEVGEAEPAAIAQVAEPHKAAVDEAEAEPQTLYVKNLAWKTGLNSRQRTCMLTCVIMYLHAAASACRHICCNAAIWTLQMMPRSDAILTKQRQQRVAHAAQQRYVHGICGDKCINYDLKTPSCIHHGRLYLRMSAAF
jgi:hypothetical protein